MKKLYLLLALAVAGMHVSFAQLIWHTNLGTPPSEQVSLSWNDTSYTIVAEDGDEFSPGNAVEEMNRQLLDNGIRWVRVLYIDNAETGTYLVELQLDPNTTSGERSVAFGTYAVTSISSKNPSIRIRPSTGRPTAVSTSVRGSPQKFICTTRRSTRAISYGGPTRTIPRRRLTSSSVRVAIIPIASLLRARTGSTSRIRTFQSSTTRHSSMSTMPAKRFSQPIPTAAYIDTH